MISSTLVRRGELRVIDLLFRAWYYFRIGYGTYLGLIVGFVTFVSTTYYLAISRIPYLQEIFSHFFLFSFIMIAVIVPLAIVIGWFHMKRTVAYSTEVSISVESNPYNYIIVPGKEEEVFYPQLLMILNSLQKIMEKQNLLTEEEIREFEKIRTNIGILQKGGSVGKIRLRSLRRAS